jgi:hypothetical protein
METCHGFETCEGTTTCPGSPTCEDTDTCPGHPTCTGTVTCGGVLTCQGTATCVSGPTCYGAATCVPDPSCACDCTWHGDLNADMAINPVDVVYIVNYVYKGIDMRSRSRHVRVFRVIGTATAQSIRLTLYGM